MVNILYYDFLSQFKRMFYKDLLTIENLVGHQIKIDKMSFPGGNIDDAANFWGYVLEKNGVKYLLSSTDIAGKEVNLGKLLPIFATNLLKVASKGTVYHWIKKPISAKIRPVKTKTFKEVVDILSSLKHTNMEHQKLMWFMGITQLYDRANFRISTPAGFGKDSTVDILGSLIGKANTIENPTLAKLEYMCSNKWLAINEVIDIKKGDWRTMEQFLLSAGAQKSEITKHSRATTNGVKEILDLSSLSLSLMYNDIDHYPNADLYFDTVTKKAVLDRFPPLRLNGEFTEDFNSVKDYDVEAFAKEKYEIYKDLIGNFVYYQKNILDTMHRYKIKGLRTLPKRWKLNIGRLLKIIDMYCESQEEFDKWVNIINTSMIDYEDMLRYPSSIEIAHKKLSGEDFQLLHKKLKEIKTFTTKLEVIKGYLKPEQVIRDVPLDRIW